MFKPGDKVKRVGRNFNNIERGGIYEVDRQIDSGLYLVGYTYEYYARSFELVKEEEVPMGSQNPCIKTEEVKVIKSRVQAGRLDTMHYVNPIDNNTIILSSGAGAYHYNAMKLRTLARQLDEIANVLESQE